MLKSIAIITVLDGIIKALGFLIIPLYLLWMPKSEYGEFGYILNILLMLPAILTLGLYVPQIKESAASDEKNYKDLVFSSTFTLVAMLSIILLSLLSLSQYYIDLSPSIFLIHDNIKFKWIAILVIIFFSSLNLILYSLALSYQQPFKIIKYNSIKFLFTNLFSLLILYIGLGYCDATLDRLVGLSIAESLLCFLTFYWLGRDFWTWKVDFNYLKIAIRNGLPIIPGSIAALISAMSDRFFLGKYFDTSYIAEYNLAQQILMPLNMVVTSAQTMWAPHIFSEKENNNAEKKSIKFFLYLLSFFFLLIPALMFLVYLARMYNFIPSTYNDTFLLVPSLSVGAICLALMNIPFNLFIRSNKTSWIAYISIFGALLTVTCSSLMIPNYGYFGGALVGGIVNITMLAIAWWCVNQLNIRK